MSTGGILVAAVASVALNTSYVLQHSGLTAGPALQPRRPVASLRALLRSRHWLAGAMLGYVGLGLELFAMTLAPLWLVQCVLAVGLVAVLAVWSRARGGAAAGTMVPAALLLGVGLLALAVTGAGGTSGITAGPATLGAVGLGAAGLAAMVLTRHGLGSAARHGIAAGILYGATTVGFAAILSALRAPVLDVGTAAAAGALAAVTAAGGFCCFQRGLQAGEPIAVVTTMTAGMNAIAIAAGVVLAGSSGLTGAAAAVQAAGLLAICAAGAVAAYALTRQQA